MLPNAANAFVGWTMAHEFGHCLGIGDYYTHFDAGEAGFELRHPSIMNRPDMHATSEDIHKMLEAFISGRWQDWG